MEKQVAIIFNESELSSLISLTKDDKKLNLKIKQQAKFPIDFEINKSFENVARIMMQECQYENGMCNRYEPESYPDKWCKLIADTAELFFTANPSLFTIDVIKEIGCGGEKDEMYEKYGSCKYWEEMNRVMDHYFDHYPEEDEPQGIWELIDESSSNSLMTTDDKISETYINNLYYRCQVCGTKIKHNNHDENTLLVCKCDRIEKK